MGVFTLTKLMEGPTGPFRGQAWKWYPSFLLTFHWPELVTWGPLDAKNVKSLDVILVCVPVSLFWDIQFCPMDLSILVPGLNILFTKNFCYVF